MARREGSAGRPWTKLRGDGPEENELADLLRTQLDNRGMTLGQLADALKAEFPDGNMPGVSTLSKRFAGEGLQGTRSGTLVRAVIQICASPDDVEALQARAEELLGRVRARESMAEISRARGLSAAVIAPPPPGTATEMRRLREELERERELRHRTERTLTFFMGLLAAGAAAEPPGPFSASAPPAEQVETSIAPEPLRQAAPEVKSSPARPQPPTSDAEFGLVVHWFRHADPDGARTLSAIRHATDGLLDGPGTGRYSVAQLSKPERAFLGRRVELAIQREFGLPDSADLDFSVDGVDVEFKFSGKRAGWLISRQLVGRVVLLVYSDEERGTWGAGLLRVTPEMLAGPTNRDGKSSLRRTDLAAVTWLAEDSPLPRNVFLRLGDEAAREVFAKQGAVHRVAELARRAEGEVIEFNDVATAAMQLNAWRRLREARELLAQEGLQIVSAADNDRTQALDVPPLGRDQLAIVRYEAGAGQ
ncbi:NaeI family type II restriction endonuclease [Catenuloplanes indicus]|uniref:Type II restriction enzyme NaeI domain-containing protein n=1 Tax=Catenuloplanes indicus TaxID=137267 RepID=A0AAE4B0G2_9ACTN|nr:NaeI family type II restriction endonuclease [Catenuloplanes indicus]MDQ0369527.1 hypothetical protein [Catenuloplanes indicus]